MTKFKVGDSVKIIRIDERWSDSNAYKSYLGKSATILGKSATILEGSRNSLTYKIDIPTLDGQQSWTKWYASEIELDDVQPIFDKLKQTAIKELQ